MPRSLKRQAGNIALVLGAITLLVVVLVTRGRVTTSEKDARASNLLPAFRDDDISRLVLERGGQKLVLERGPAGDAGEPSWLIREPIEEEADPFAVDKLLGSLEFARVVRRIKPEEVNPESFGLRAPKWVLSLEMGKLRYELRLGSEAASPSGSHYLELVTRGTEGSGVVIVGRDLVKELDIDASALRGRQLMPYLSSELGGMLIRGTDGSERRFARLGESAWRFRGLHGDARVDREAFDGVVVQLARLKAEHFLAVPEAEAALGGKAPAVSLTLEPKDPAKPKARVEVGGSCPVSADDAAAVRREPTPLGACVPKSVIAGLDVSPASLVDKHTFWMRKDEVERLSIEGGGKKLELERKESGFVLRSPVKGDVDLETGDQRLESVLRAEGKLVESPDPKRLGLAPPWGRVTVTSSAATEQKVEEESLEVGARQSDGRRFARRVADGIVLELAPDAARAFEPDATLVRKKALLDYAAGDLTSLEIKTPSLHQKLHRDATGVLVLDVPKGFTHDGGLASALIDELSRLTADRWVADSDDGSFGLAQPRARVALAFQTGDAASRQHTLLVGAPTSGGAFAALEGEPGVFVVPRRLVDALDTWLLDRSPFIVTPDRAERVTLGRDGKKIVLERRGDRFEAAAGTTLAEARVAELAETLMTLRAEAALHLGAPKPGEGFDKPLLRVEIDGKQPSSFQIGAGDAWQGTSVHYARAAGLDATYVVAKSKIRVLLEAF